MCTYRARPLASYVAASCALLSCAVGSCVLPSCAKATPNEPPPSARESPQAKAEPTPLANAPAPGPTNVTAPVGPDSGPPPVPMRGDLPAFTDSVGAKEATGWSLRAVLRPIDPPPPFRAAETSASALEAIRKKTEPRLAIDLAAAHARLVFDGDGFVLPEGTELRARADRYGFIVLLPGASSYRIAAPGSLRALFGERRIDVTPLSPAEIVPKGEGPRRLGFRTRRVEVQNRVATATIDVAHAADLGEGGILLCRALLDMMNAPASTAVCGYEEVPLHAEFRWATRPPSSAGEGPAGKPGGLVFDAFAIARRTDIGTQTLAAPPASAAFTLPAIDGEPARLLVSPGELAALRTTGGDAPASAQEAGEPEAGLLLANSSDELRFVWLDGVPIGWLTPGARLAIPTLPRGKYTLQWRTFLSDAAPPAQSMTAPARIDFPVADAGTK